MRDKSNTEEMLHRVEEDYEKLVKDDVFLRDARRRSVE